MKKGILIATGLLLVAAVAFAGGAEEQTSAAPTDGEMLMEAPQLAELVAAGDLPPVEERLPVNPMVLEGVDGLGQYGGAWRQVHLGPNDRFQNAYFFWQALGKWNKDFTRVIPTVAESWEWSDEGRQITFTLREGMKWSDGDDFNSDDIAFWYNDVLMKDELGVNRASLSVAGEVAEFEQIDELRFSFTFAEPNFIFEETLPSFALNMLMPEHYLRPLHVDYGDADEIEAAMEEGGFQVWSEFFNLKIRYMDPNTIGVPTLLPWMQTNAYDQPVHVLERNPYYWQVDSAGRQLPYLDRIERRLVPDSEGMVLAAIAGEVDLQDRRVRGVSNRTAAVENQERGNYTVVGLGSTGQNPWTIYFNWYQDDEFKADLYSDHRFRQALSVAINRSNINELLYKGLGVATNSVVGPAYLGWDADIAALNSEFDPELANQLLDEAGLTERDSDGFRLRTDNGEKLTLVVNMFQPGGGMGPETWEIIREDWAEVGIDLAVRPVERSLWHASRQAYDFDLSSYYGPVAWLGNSSYIGSPQFYAADNDYTYWGQRWADWLLSNGAEGVEAPEPVKALYEIYQQMPGTQGRSARAELEQDMLRLHAEELYMIGTAIEPPEGEFIFRHNTFMNVDTDVDYFAKTTQFPALFYRGGEVE